MNLFSWFSGPLSTVAGKAINEILESKGKEKPFQPCWDAINSYTKGPNDAVEAFAYSLKNTIYSKPGEASLTIDLLDACAKHCFPALLHAIRSSDLLYEFQGYVLRKSTVAIRVKDKILNLIQIWAFAFNTQQYFFPFLQLYNRILEEGIDFPEVDNQQIEIYTSLCTQKYSQVPPSNKRTSQLAQNLSSTSTQLEASIYKLDFLINNNAEPAVIYDAFNAFSKLNANLMTLMGTLGNSNTVEMTQLLEEALKIQDDAIVCDRRVRRILSGQFGFE